MFAFPITDYRRFTDLPLDKLRPTRYKVYILDLNWNYLFVNDAVVRDLPDRRTDLIGMNMWEVFNELRRDPTFQQIRVDIEHQKAVDVTTTSPITRKRLRIFGWPMEDCYVFSVNMLPDKFELLNELRGLLNKASLSYE
jgi:hypothetical protein